ncbi:MAG: hypothetical protein IKU14_01215 [Rhodocyclaceae bacterium]|nr:hypothetical protein [Rhodocyclaceae bacterium]
MRKLFYAIGAAICLATSNLASAGVCYNMNVYNYLGTTVYPNGNETIYGPFKAACPSGIATFTFEDLSGNFPTNTILHILEVKTGASSWTPVYQVVTRSVRSHSFQYGVSYLNEYRYRVENIGSSTIMGWSMEGRVPAAYIP